MEKYDINEYFDKIFIINLENRTDRWAEVIDELAKKGIHNYERFEAIRPAYGTIPKKYKDYFDSVNRSDGTDKIYTIGCYGCKTSHLSVIKIAKNRKYKNVLVFEDDIMFHPDALEIFSKAAGQIGKWDMFYMTGNHIGGCEKVGDQLIRIHGSHSGVGYAVHKRMFNTILNESMGHGKHMDMFYSEHIHPRGLSYCTYPNIVWNRPNFSDIEQGHRRYKKLYYKHEDWLNR